MRAGIIAAAFAATVLAVPMEQKRDVVTDTDVKVVYATEFVTVTAGNSPAATPEAAPTAGHWGHNPHWWGGAPNKGHKQSPKPTTTKQTATWEPAPTQKTKTTTAASSPTASAPSSGGSGGGYQGMVIDQHNIHRANHSASNIQWDQTLANNAAQVAASCVYAHNTQIGGIPQGQNIAAGVVGTSVDRIITNMFYDGEVNWYEGLYGEAQPSMSNFEHWGHFSQIVWKSTTHVGCATQYCPNGLANVGSDVPPYFTVCNYSPPGNFANEYGDNIGKPLGHPNVVI